MPKTESLLSQIGHIARTQYEPEYPDNPLEWKIHAFQSSWMNATDTWPMETRKILFLLEIVFTNVMPCNRLKWLPNAFIKSVKFGATNP